MRVLFITSSRIGDAVLTTGILDYVTRTVPNLQLAIAAGPVAMPLFDDWPYVIWRHTFVKKGRFGHWLDLWKRAKGTSWDWIIDLRGSAFSYTLKAKRRSIWKKPRQCQHRVHAIANVITLSPAPAPHLYISKERLDKVYPLIRTPFMVLAPAANWLGKEWPLERFKTLIHQLLQGPMRGWHVLIVAAPDEYPRLNSLIQSLDPSALLSIDPERFLLDSAALIQQASFFIGNDSGLMHMAAALKIPTVGLFGPSPAVLYDPYGPLGCAVRTPLSYDALMEQRKATPHACFMESLTVERVYTAVCDHGIKTGSFSCAV